MTGRIVLVVTVMAVSLLGSPSLAENELRAPQVNVSSDRLQSFFDGIGSTVRVETQQRAQQTGPLPIQQPGDPTSFDVNLQLLDHYPVGTVLGVYNASEASPTLMPVFPAEATPGWLAILSFRRSPQRLVVHLLDENTLLLRNTTFLGADPTNFSFYLQTPNGTFFMQDARNPGGSPQMLLFTDEGGPYWTDSWLCWEDQSVGAGSDQDYDDAVIVTECSNCFAAVERSTWGAVKQRFR
jgi:hypothetical protein